MQICYVAEALYEKAQAQYFEKKYSETLKTLNRALEILQTQTQPPLQAQIYLLIAKTNLNMVQYGNTRRICYQGIKFTQKHNQHQELAKLYLILGQLYTQQSQYQEAIQAYLDSLSILPIHGNSHTENLLRAQLHLSLGEAAREIQNTDLQKTHFLKSLFIAQRLDDQLLIAHSLLGLGISFFQQQKLPLARTTLLKAQQIFQDAHDLKGFAMTLIHLGQLYVKNIEYRRAVNTFRSAYAIFEELSDPIHQADSLAHLAQIFLKIDIHMTHRLCQEATDLLVAQPSIQSKRQSEIILGRIFVIMGQYYEQTKEVDLALNSFKEGLEIFDIHQCQFDYDQTLPLYEKLMTSKPPVKPKKSNILAFKLGMSS